MKNPINNVFSLVACALTLVCSADTALGQTNTINASPGNLAFFTASGTPQPQQVTYSSASGSNIAFTITTSSTPNFLGVSQTSGVATATPQTFQVFTQNLNSLAAGTYNGSVTLTPSTGPAVVVPVTLTVGSGGGGGGGGGTYIATPSPVVFNVAAGTGTASQTVALSTSGSGGTVTLSTSGGATWLQVSPAFVTLTTGSPVNFTATVTPGALAPGSYSAFINVSSGSTQVLSIPVSLTVGASTGTGGVTANPGSLVFSFASSASPSSIQSVQVTTTSNTFENVIVTPTTNSGGNWLSTNQPSFAITSSIPATLYVTVNPSGLTTGSSYTGNIALQTADFGVINVPVTVNVGTTSGGGGTLTATPNPVNLVIAAGSTTPASQTLSVTSTGAATTVSAQTSGLNWLTVNPIAAQVGAGSPGTFTISANPSGQSSGIYNGSVILTPAGGTPLTIPVTVTLGTAATIVLNPQVFSFAYQTGTATPAAQTLSVSSTGSAVTFGVTGTTQTGGNWLVISPQTGVTNASGGAPTPVSIQVNPAGLQPGAYTGTISVNANGAVTQTIPVSLVVSNQPILQLSNGSVTFNYQFNSATQPAQQQIQVTSSGNPLTFNVSTAPGSGGNFLTVTPSFATTPQTLNLSINPTVAASLAPGTYQSTVTLTSQGGGNSPLNIPVTLVVGNSILLNASQTSLNFNYQITQGLPVNQTIDITSTGTPLPYSVSAASANCGGNFLSVNPAMGTTPGTIGASINVSGLTPGTCNGTITITSPGAGNTPLTIPVTVQVSNSPLLNVSPGAITVTTQVGTTPPSRTIALTSTDPSTALSFNVGSTTNNGGAGWLLVGPTSGSTPNNLTIGFQTAGLPVGTYTGSITVTPTAAGLSPTVIPVTLVITSNATAAASPASLVFNQSFGGSQAATQTLAITSTTTGLSFSATATTLSGGNWLSVTPSGGTTPGSVTVSTNGSNLGQGSYSGVVTIVIPGAANSPINIPVTLNIGPPQTLALTPLTLNFAYQAGSATGPAVQNIQVTSTSGVAQYTVTSTSGNSGLITVAPVSGSTPGTIGVTVNQAVLATLSPGTYTGTVTVTGLTGGSQTVAVNVVVTAAQPPAITTLVNSASNAPGTVSPGEIVTIYGTNIGPATGAAIQFTAGGQITTTLGNTVVTFDGIPAPLIYASSGQINAIVPYEIAGRVTTNVIVQRNGLVSAALQLRVSDSAPAIFSASQTGNGQGAILNFNSAVNSSANPAAKGSVIQIFATGEGALLPQVATGSVTSSTGPNFPKPTLPVSVTIGGLPATVTYAGEAPGLVSGLLQVNAIVPTGLTTSGPQTVVLTVGGASNSQQTITVAVQ